MVFGTVLNKQQPITEMKQKPQKKILESNTQNAYFRENGLTFPAKFKQPLGANESSKFKELLNWGG